MKRIKCDSCRKFISKPYDKFLYFLKGNYHPTLPDKTKLFLVCSEKCFDKMKSDYRLCIDSIDSLKIFKLLIKRVDK